MSSIITDTQQSRILNSLRFPLACMVVIIHCNISQDKWILPQWPYLTSGEEFSVAIQILFSILISGIAVPTFYLISGYFFFYHLENFYTFNIYKQKLKKRIKTLFIPYLVWNTIYILYIVICKIAAYLFKGKPLSNISDFFEINGWWRMYWDCSTWAINRTNILGYYIPPTGPILVPLWFIRDLMVVILFTPVIYILLRKFKLLTILALGICYVTGIWPYLHGFSITAIFFFSLGAYFSIYHLNMVNELRKIQKINFTLLIPLLILSIYFNGNLTAIGEYIYPFYIIVGVVTVINLMTIFEEKKKLPAKSKLNETTFFVYCFHGLIGLRISGIILNRLFPISDNYWPYITIHYLLKPIITITFCIAIFRIMKKYCPSLLNILIGYRKS